VSRLETSRDVIYEAIRVSFAAAYDALVLDPADRVSNHRMLACARRPAFAVIVVHSAVVDSLRLTVLLPALLCNAWLGTHDTRTLNDN
jgi:hypothetical protein